MQKIEGNIIDIHNREIYPGEISIVDGRIKNIVRNSKIYTHYISPGLIDAHVHIESSMLTPEHFSKLIIQRGTIAIVNDPHEIANVLGSEGIKFMLENNKKAIIKSFFGIPSCVPATPFDSAGYIISAPEIEELAKTGKFIMLSEVMNVPGVLYGDTDMIAKLEIAKKYNLQIDGHAPMLSGQDLSKYISYGITTDHECSTIEEANEKIRRGMKIMIRDGSAAKNYEALKSLIKTNPDDVMFCTDDAHPDEIIEKGHIDKIVKKALKDGFDFFDTLKIASVNPAKHYKLDVGSLKIGDKGDFIRIENLESFEVSSVYIDGRENYKRHQIRDICEQNGTNLSTEGHFPNNFNHDFLSQNEIAKTVKGNEPCIEIIKGEIITRKSEFHVKKEFLNFESDIEKDILKIVYLNRYHNSPPQVAYISGIGLKTGAFATSIAHDSHNILAVGCQDKDIISAINAIIKTKGGLSVYYQDQIHLLPLPIGGIMSEKSGEEVACKYKDLNNKLKLMGSTLESPFMTLAFMSLIVIPEFKIGEKGLFDFNKFDFI